MPSTSTGGGAAWTYMPLATNASATGNAAAASLDIEAGARMEEDEDEDFRAKVRAVCYLCLLVPAFMAAFVSPFLADNPSTSSAGQKREQQL